MKNLWIWVIVVIVILGAGIWWWSSSQGSAPTVVPQAVGTQTQQVDGAYDTGTTTPASANPTAPMSASVTYDGNSFSPSTVTVAKGGTVTFTSSAGQMWIASDPHPIHNGYDGTTEQEHCAAGYSGAKPFDMCAAGTSFTFTFDKIGNWGYHDHLNASIGGTVDVVAQ